MNKTNKGFTLIEVLIALAILSIALTAILKSTSQYTQNMFYLQQKTKALWVGTQILNEARLGLLKIPMAPETLDIKTDLLGQSWISKIQLKPSRNPHIEELTVTVFQSFKPLMTLTSYRYVNPKEKK